MKPHIKKVKTMWRCSNGKSVAGYGLTPADAYKVWEVRTADERYRYVLA